ALHATGMLAKFCAEEIEGVDKGQVEAQMATGGSRMQVILFGVTPQIVPQFIGYAIYRLDVSIRSATVLGLVGAGGLGFSLIQTMKLFKYHQTATCILVIFLLVLVSDWICGKLRRRVIWGYQDGGSMRSPLLAIMLMTVLAACGDGGKKSDAHLAAGQALLDQGKYDAALPELQRAVEANKD